MAVSNLRPDGIEHDIRTAQRELDFMGQTTVLTLYQSVIKSTLKVKMDVDVSDGEDVADLSQNGESYRDEP